MSNDGDISHLSKIATKVDHITHTFLQTRELYYFQFKRVYKDGSFIILANYSEFFNDFLEFVLVELPPINSIYARQSSIFFWDESLTEASLTSLKEQNGIYHGITILCRQKEFLDCTTYARTEIHATPYAYYFNIIKELQIFTELFPVMAQSLIKKEHETLTTNPKPHRGMKPKNLLLPKRSTRLRIGDGTTDYITTYEAFCIQFLRDGRSYKEIATILSIAPSTVETHLKRLKARTGLSLQELLLHSFQNYEHKKGTVTLENVSLTSINQSKKNK